LTVFPQLLFICVILGADITLRGGSTLIGITVRVVQILLLAAMIAAATTANAGVSVRPLWPVYGVMTQWFSYCGKRCGHAGLDIAAPHGTPVYAAMSGTVTRSGWDRFGYGQLIVIRGIDRRDYYYAHNSRLYVRVGQRIQQGRVISRVGSTGRSSGPHLHFEIRSGNRILNPAAVLPRSRMMLASTSARPRD
jgi:lysostaphin